ncbi:MAG: GHKL domain-containing protein [Acetatifactor sp.]|nr:GHKL domain-containing protein [Acetatifactor sp.]
MKYLPLDIAINLTEYWILILMTQYICSAHMNLRRRNVLLCSGISILGVFFVYWVAAGSLLSVLTMLGELVLTVLLFSRKRLSDLPRLLAAMAIFYTLMITPMLLLESIMPNILIPIFPDHTYTWYDLITDVLFLGSLLFLGCVLRKYQTPLHFRPGEILGSIVLALFSFIDAGLVIFLYYAHLEPVQHYIFLVLFLGAFVLSTGYFLYGVISSRMRIYREALARSQTEYLQLQLEALQDVKEQEEQVRRLRHDLTSHMAMIQTLCQEGNYREVKKYAEQLSQNTISPGGGILTGNKVADLVVRSKMKICEERGIEFTFTGALSGFDALDAPDICSLLSNAYDNAIEACMSQENAYIRTTVHTTPNHTAIQIVNPVSKKVSIRNNRAASSKKDKAAHGYGIDIMRRIAYKYGGSCTLHCDKREFTVKIVVLT